MTAISSRVMPSDHSTVFPREMSGFVVERRGKIGCSGQWGRRQRSCNGVDFISIEGLFFHQEKTPDSVIIN
jgi:hypothetical protein